MNNELYNLTIYTKVRQIKLLEFELTLSQVSGFYCDVNEKKFVRIGPFIFKSDDIVFAEFNKIDHNEENIEK